MVSSSAGAVRSGRLVARVAAAIAVVAAIVVLAWAWGGDAVTGQVAMVGQRFDPVTIRVRSTAAHVQVHNADLYLHDIALPETGLLVRVAPERTTTVDFGGIGPGTYTVYCTLHSDLSESDPSRAGMAATLVVE